MGNQDRPRPLPSYREGRPPASELKNTPEEIANNLYQQVIRGKLEEILRSEESVGDIALKVNGLADDIDNLLVTIDEQFGKNYAQKVLTDLMTPLSSHYVEQYENKLAKTVYSLFLKRLQVLETRR